MKVSQKRRFDARDWQQIADYVCDTLDKRKKARKDDTGYDSHDWVLRELKRAQEADQDVRLAFWQHFSQRPQKYPEPTGKVDFPGPAAKKPKDEEDESWADII